MVSQMRIPTRIVFHTLISFVTRRTTASLKECVGRSNLIVNDLVRRSVNGCWRHGIEKLSWVEVTNDGTGKGYEGFEVEEEESVWYSYVQCHCLRMLEWRLEVRGMVEAQECGGKDSNPYLLRFDLKNGS